MDIYEQEELYNSAGLIGPGNVPKKVSSPNKPFKGAVPKKKTVKEPKRCEKSLQLTGDQLILDHIDTEIESMAWAIIVCGDSKAFKNTAKRQDVETRQKLQEKFALAQAYWKCQECESHDLTSAKTGFLSCYICKDKLHTCCFDDHDC